MSLVEPGGTCLHEFKPKRTSPEPPKPKSRHGVTLASGAFWKIPTAEE